MQAPVKHYTKQQVLEDIDEESNSKENCPPADARPASEALAGVIDADALKHAQESDHVQQIEQALAVAAYDIGKQDQADLAEEDLDAEINGVAVRTC